MGLAFTMSLLSFFLPLIQPVQAWGTLGHATVASIATYYLLPGSLQKVNSILAADTDTVPKSRNSSEMLVNIASWADSFRYTSRGRFSEPYHFIDAKDDPPNACSVDLSRDCTTGGCVVSAIANYTLRVQDKTLGPLENAEALKFLTHFIGDIHQPLHDENLDNGANGIDILWKGKKQNLHHIWDTEMPEKIGGKFSAKSVTSWTSTIIKELKTGSYMSSVQGWQSCNDIQNASGCALTWAAEANQYVCSFVISSDPTDTELSGVYFDKAKPIIQEQIAKAGVRLAAWLNVIFAGSSGFD
ncbi:hypothetical protein FRB96_001894 [Tulasnella sp. 330]|nr:hypothetical protein FRB96_001894 [Tulasnella sp. 330]